MSETALLSPLEPVVRASIADQVFDVLHQQVLSLALPPGTKMSEAEIAKQLNVSRASRCAMRFTACPSWGFC